MSKKNIYHSLVDEETWGRVLKDNKDLLKDFLDYCRASDKSPQTIYQYEQQLRVVFVWILNECENKFFCDIKKREWVRFVGYLVNDLEASPNRVASIKSAISSFSNYIENILDEEFNYRNIIKNIPIPAKEKVRERDPLSEEQIYNCLEELVNKKKYQIACFLALLFASGMRKAEIIQMTIDDVSEERKVMNGMFYLTNKIRTKGKGKAGKILQKYILCDIVDPYLTLWMQYRKENCIDSPYLFVVYHNGQYEQAKISTANSFGEIIAKILNVNTSIHNLRHAWVDFLIRKGYPDSVIQKLQGWSSTELVSYYSDISEQEELENFFMGNSNNNDVKGDL